MKKNRLGKSDIYISELTLGCMSIGTDHNKAIAVVEEAIERGVNHLDTADLYDFGENEKILSHIIKNKKRDQIKITSKVGNHFDPATREWFWDPSREHIESGIKESLKRLQTDYIDLYLLHGGTIDDPIDEVVDTMEGLKKDGLIRAYGISSIRPNVIREYVKRSNINAVMLQYNLLDRRPEEEVLDLLLENEISVLARGPLAKGILSNQGTNKIKTLGNDGYLDYTSSELVGILDKLSDFTNDRTMNDIALKYVLHHPAVASAVFGASSISQVQENMKEDSRVAFSNELYESIQQISKPIVYKNHRD